jgi:hypothetical protein
LPSEQHIALAPAREGIIGSGHADFEERADRTEFSVEVKDLTAIQRRAVEEGIPYQTLVASILHKYVSGSLYDATANRAVNSDHQP